MKNKVYAIFYLFYFFGGEGGGETRCAMGAVQMANSILRASFLFYLFSIYSIIYLFIYLFIYLLTGYRAMYALQYSAQLTYQLEHVVTLVR